VATNSHFTFPTAEWLPTGALYSPPPIDYQQVLYILHHQKHKQEAEIAVLI
jgi:hypothetical protein